MNNYFNKTQNLKNYMLSTIALIRKAEKEGLSYTPLGYFVDDITNFLYTKDIITNWNKDAKYYVFTPTGEQKYDNFRREVLNVVKNNPEYKQHKWDFEPVDVILTFRSKRFIYTPKQKKSLDHWNKTIVDIVPTEEELKEFKIFQEWENELNSKT